MNDLDREYPMIPRPEKGFAKMALHDYVDKLFEEEASPEYIQYIPAPMKEADLTEESDSTATKNRGR